MVRKTNYISSNYKINKSNDILYQDIQDELIILNMSDENYLGLDETGTRFWKILLSADSVKEAYEQLLEEYDVDPKVLYVDMNNFIQGLLDTKLIIISKT